MTMQSTGSEERFRKQSRLLLSFGGGVIALAMGIGMFSLFLFHDAEKAWEVHSARSAAVGEALTEMNLAIGYGGFIHNFKNLVLRRDPSHYKKKIDANIRALQAVLPRLELLLTTDKEQKALKDIQHVFEHYIRNYKTVASLIKSGATPNEIDAMVAINDRSALNAISYLNNRTIERVSKTERFARKAQNIAENFAFFGGALVFCAMSMLICVIRRFLRKLVTANNSMRQTQEKLDILLDTAPDPMLSVKQGGHIVRVNHMAEHFFGYSKNELLGMMIEQLIPERFQHQHASQRENYFSAPHNRPMGTGLALVAQTRDGREPNVEISLSHSGEGEDKLVTITLRDVTEQEHNRRALQEARQQAESTLALQQEMQHELVQAEKLAALGGLVAGIAHEINTPVGVTLSAATHLETETKTVNHAYQSEQLSEEELVDYFTTAKQATKLITMNSHRAADLIQSFKQVAVDQTGGERRIFNIAQYIDEVLLSLRPNVKKTHVKIRVDCPEKLTLDTFPGAFSQVLTNLIMNALIHAFEPAQMGHIDIKICSIGENGEQVRIIFSDDGKGIPAKLQARVFEPFFTTRRHAGGSGLGLHIIHTIITQTLKGTFKMTSVPAQGTTFTIDLPRIL